MAYVRRKKDRDRRERNEKRGICLPARNEGVAISGIVVIFGIERVEEWPLLELTSFINSDTPRFSQASRGP